MQFGVPIKDEHAKDAKLAVAFRFITFESNAYFIRTNFAADTAFQRINFKKEADFTDASFEGKKDGRKPNLSLS